MKNLGYAFAVTLTLASCASVRAQLPSSADAFSAMIRAERQFAADARAHGVPAAFRASAAPDAIQLRPDPVPANQEPDAADDGPALSLDWWPEVAGVARSGDLGFTSGPYVAGEGPGQVHGFFLTVWRRQPDGTWRWVLDHGLPPSDGPTPVPSAMVRRIASGAVGVTPEIARVDAAVNQALSEGGEAALLSWLDADARLMRPGAEPVTGIGQTRTLLAKRTQPVIATLAGQGTSQAGDYAYTYGGVRLATDGRRGAYVRVWRRDPSGWRLIVDEVT